MTRALTEENGYYEKYTQCWKQKHDVKTKTMTKSIRPRPRSVWDQSCHKTAVLDPKTVSDGSKNASDYYK